MHPGIQKVPPGGCGEKAGIYVENIDFSTLSTGFSTGGFPLGKTPRVCNSVYITETDGFRQNAHFSGCHKNHHPNKPGEKKDLTAFFRFPGGSRKKTGIFLNFFEKRY